MIKYAAKKGKEIGNSSGCFPKASRIMSRKKIRLESTMPLWRVWILVS